VRKQIRFPCGRAQCELMDCFDGCHDGIFIMKSDGEVVYVNQAWVELTGIQRETIIGLYPHEILKRGYFSEPVFDQVTKKLATVTVMNKTPRGIDVLTTGTPITDENGQLRWVVLNVRDITELIELKEKLEREKRISRSFKEEISALRAKCSTETFVHSENPAMLRVMDLVNRVAESTASVLLTGETGVGKEVVARLIHMRGSRKNGPFIKVNCAAIPEALFESELFGYESGAFTGANRRGKCGLFELANEGTLFLDEVGELSLSSQAKLLQAIEDRQVYKVGGTSPVALDVRIISATNKDLRELVAQGKFRQDLYFRLNVVTIEIPPLRARAEDIPRFFNHFLSLFNRKYGKEITLSSAAVDALLKYHWPGNVRELKNVVERLVATSSNQEIQVSDLPLEITSSCISTDGKPAAFSGLLKTDGENLSLDEYIERIKREIVAEAIRQYGSTRKAARFLKTSQSKIIRILHRTKSGAPK